MNSQILDLSPTCPLPRGFEPCGSEVYRQSVPVGIDSCGPINTLPNIISVQPFSNTLSLNPSSNAPVAKILNLSAPTCVQNQPLCNQPVISPVLPSQPIVSSLLPKCTNVQCPVCTPQLAPSVIANSATSPVVTVVDNTLANSLANALQLLIISNLLENTGTSNVAQNFPCINNCEIVTPDFAVPSCDYFSNMVFPEPIITIPEPVFSCPEPVFSSAEPVVPCPEQMVFAYPNFGGSFSVDSSGFPCGGNQVFLENPGQFVTQVAPACSQPIAPIPAVAAIPPMALEVPFPAEIPAQLTCNFGFSASNEPCVTFNVEPVACNNLFGNYGNFV